MLNLLRSIYSDIQFGISSKGLTKWLRLPEIKSNWAVSLIVISIGLLLLFLVVSALALLVYILQDGLNNSLSVIEGRTVHTVDYIMAMYIFSGLIYLEYSTTKFRFLEFLIPFCFLALVAAKIAGV